MEAEERNRASTGQELIVPRVRDRRGRIPAAQGGGGRHREAGVALLRDEKEEEPLEF